MTTYRNIKKFIGIFFLVLLFLLLLFAVKGNRSGETIGFQSSYDRVAGGPFESSGSTSRYALTQAIVENNSLFLNFAQTEFAAPDVADTNGKYFSIFTPGVSVIGAPLYLLGKTLGAPQLFTYFLNIIFAVIDLLLVARLARKAGANAYTSLVSGTVFVFATNLLPYAGSYTQHVISSFVILLSLINALDERTFVNNLFLGVLLGIALLLDIPNLFLLLPILIYVTVKHFFVSRHGNNTKFGFKLMFFWILAGLLPFLIFFGWYNYKTAGSILKLAQFVGRSKIYAQQDVPTTSESGIKFNSPFKTRNQLLGSYILTLSSERGVFYYSPVLILGLIGFYLIFKNGKNRPLSYLLFSITLMNLVTYSMFSDYHGGWAFGSRYMIPAEAMLSIGVGYFLEHYLKSKKVFVIFIVLVSYSIFVSTLGAVTTTNIPPKVEAITLPAPVTYTYKYNLSLVKNGNVGSLIYNLLLKNKISAQSLVYLYSGILVLIIASLQTMAMQDSRKHNLSESGS